MGLPEGWKFYYTCPTELAWPPVSTRPGLAGLVLVSPAGEEHATFESVSELLGSENEVKRMRSKFFSFIGATGPVDIPDHVLLGKETCWKWTDVEGRTKIVYGVCSAAEEEDGTVKINIEYDKESRAIANSGHSHNRALVPESEKFSEDVAWGACLNYDPRASAPGGLPHYNLWHVPETRHEDFEEDEEGMFCPRLTIHFRGFRLVFAARKSTIPNAGKGVFVSCTSMNKKKKYLELKAGELLDLGVYAPFRIEDNKKYHVFFMKNFIHGGKVGEWSFDTPSPSYTYDITDDTTGDLHNLAQAHIPAYVNETDGEATPAVHARHDPAGCVHYLLGHAFDFNEPYRLAADGTFREVMIDYGPTYEDHRVRKGYSRLPPAEAVAQHEKLARKEHLEELEEFLSYDLSELVDCLHFFSTDVFKADRRYKVSVVTRSLLVTAHIKALLETKVADSMFEDNNNNGGVPATPNSEAKRPISATEKEKAIELARKLLRFFFNFWNSQESLKKSLLSNFVYKSSLRFILGDPTCLALSPAELFDKLMGS